MNYLILLLLVALAYLVKRYLYDKEDHNARQNNKNSKFKPTQDLKILPQYKLILQNQCDYYKKLSSKSKLHFEQRVQIFIDIKEFIPRGKLHMVTDEMKVLIAATAIQITFGYPQVFFSHFKKILIYPSDYLSTITNNVHQGEVNAHGLIVLSWDNFKKGYASLDDGRNLGLHEMAHAFRIENATKDREYNFIDDRLILEFQRLALMEIAKIKQNTSQFFRDYAGTNEHEFFAVAIENFFERPAKFNAYHPVLYKVITKILNQDPLKQP